MNDKLSINRCFSDPFLLGSFASYDTQNFNCSILNTSELKNRDIPDLVRYHFISPPFDVHSVMNQLQKTSVAMGQSSLSLVSNQSSDVRQLTTEISSVNIRMNCPNCGSLDINGHISVPVAAPASLSASPQSSVASSSPQSVTPEMVAKISEPVTRRTPLRECRMAGVPIVTPKRTTTPRPFRSRTEERIRKRRAREMGLDDGRMGEGRL